MTMLVLLSTPARAGIVSADFREGRITKVNSLARRAPETKGGLAHGVGYGKVALRDYVHSNEYVSSLEICPSRYDGWKPHAVSRQDADHVGIALAHTTSRMHIRNASRSQTDFVNNVFANHRARGPSIPNSHEAVQEWNSSNLRVKRTPNTDRGFQNRGNPIKLERENLWSMPDHASMTLE